MSEDGRDERTGPDAEVARDSWLERLMGRFNLRSRDSVRDDLQDVLAEASEAAELPPQERALLQNVLAFHRVRVSDVMVPRSDIVAAPTSATIGQILGLFHQVGHSRLPAYGQSLDEPLGMVHIRDVVVLIAGGGTSRLVEPGDPPEISDLAGADLSSTLGSAGIVRPVLYVPGSMPALDLLARMQASRTHIALVIDEYGGTDGLVSIEDLLEAVVGDIKDEHDKAASEIVEEEGGSLVLDARTSLEDVSMAVGHDLLAAGEADDVDTLGGLIVTQAGRVPLKGEIVQGPAGLAFEILDADRRRLKRVRIRLPAPPAAPGSASALASLPRSAEPDPRSPDRAP